MAMRRKSRTNSDQLHGALDMLVLKMLARRPIARLRDRRAPGAFVQ
jgi:hypothetical protein